MDLWKLLSVSSLIIISMVTSACTSENPNLSIKNSEQAPSISAINEKMTIEGKITVVRESWPLQLSVETDSGQYEVELLLETTITRAGKAGEPGELAANQQVKITGQVSSADETAMIAEVIEIF